MAIQTRVPKVILFSSLPSICLSLVICLLCARFTPSASHGDQVGCRRVCENSPSSTSKAGATMHAIHPSVGYASSVSASRTSLSHSLSLGLSKVISSISCFGQRLLSRNAVPVDWLSQEASKDPIRCLKDKLVLFVALDVQRGWHKDYR